MSEYHCKVKARNMNEVKSKLTYLERCSKILQLRIANSNKSESVWDKGGIVDHDYIETVRMFILQGELQVALSEAYPEAWEVYEQEKRQAYLYHSGITQTYPASPIMKQ